MAQSRGKSMLAGIQCSETRHLLRGGEEEFPKKKSDSDEELEIEGFGKTSAGKSLLSALLKPNPLQTSSLLKNKQTYSEHFKKYVDSDYDLLFSSKI
jgi:hypothetical protein